MVDDIICILIASTILFFRCKRKIVKHCCFGTLVGFVWFNGFCFKLIAMFSLIGKINETKFAVITIVSFIFI